ncbi:DUF4395 domain-containing protein [Anaerobacillus alkalilacustris]|uniref:DUF4395 domain-containing protein n=1 Tax=Anaerobacillus alkalilacustris TaxID=393763 RepID=UPI000A7B42E8|nr:DUF4395 domain-containing protein [Anaerobacillus alkalilacustris]
MLREIPISYVKTNQIIMVILTLSSIVLQSILLLFIAFLFVITPLVLGQKANLAFYIAKRLFPHNVGGETEAAVLQKFNQTIGGLLLTLALLIYLWTGSWVAWLLTGMVTLAATVALLGFCVGCFLYFQFKKLKHVLKGN